MNNLTYFIQTLESGSRNRTIKVCNLTCIKLHVHLLTLAISRCYPAWGYQVPER
jgi:hypothetical protein